MKNISLINKVYAAANDIVSTYTDTNDDVDTTIVECVANNLFSVIDAYNNDQDTYATDLLENASTYVLVDMNEDELIHFVDVCNMMIEEYDLV